MTSISSYLQSHVFLLYESLARRAQKSRCFVQGKEAVVLVTEEHYEQPVEGFTKALSVVADDVADDVSRAATNVLEFASLPRWGFPLLILRFWMFADQVIADACQTCVQFVLTPLRFLA
jgi:hypothetical protein